ncbi:MAG: Hsp20/alpha crystallin family protein, partial [Candidatus Cloacimonetes bacterium]|nr:Hsp20/alpha crystallin family protein [Candidatus Cloacimonadota bacterium]
SWDLDDFFRNYYRQSNERFSPMKVDIIEEDANYQILASLPGYSKEDVSINVNEGILTIEVNPKKEEAKYLHQERCNTECKRTFRLDRTFNTTEITAEMTNGILKISIPKSEKQAVKEITIN